VTNLQAGGGTHAYAWGFGFIAARNPTPIVIAQNGNRPATQAEPE
jgi:hypothetical protein